MLQNHAGRPVTGWRLMGDWISSIACSRMSLPSVPQISSKSMSNLGVIFSPTNCSAMSIAFFFPSPGMASSTSRSRLTAEMRTCGRGVRVLSAA